MNRNVRQMRNQIGSPISPIVSEGVRVAVLSDIAPSDEQQWTFESVFLLLSALVLSAMFSLSLS